MGGTRGAGSKRDFCKGRHGETTKTKVSLRHVDAPDAELRLEQALDVLLSGTLPTIDMVEGQDLLGDQTVEDSATDGEVN